MRSEFKRSVIGALIGVLLFCSPVLAAEYKDRDILVMDNTHFAVELYRRLSVSEGNLFFSPYSISSALAMSYAGARRNTEGEMRASLAFSLQQAQLHPAFAEIELQLARLQESGDVELRVAGSLWPHAAYPLLEEYLVLVEKHYGVSITPVDYADSESARRTINRWVEDKTRNRIQELVPSGLLSALTRLVLVNAIYFKGNWKIAFEARRTEDAPFFTATGTTVQVPLMMRKAKFGYAEDDELQILELPYAGEDVSMLILLPKEKAGLERLEHDLTPMNLGRWRSRVHRREVLVYLPRFRMTSSFRLDEALKSMGMVDAFDEMKADFSGMDGAGLLFIAAVLHKAFVDVNEKGTEAAAATAVLMEELTSAPITFPPPVFRADRPFFFLIQENSTKSILFMGRVADPARTGE